MKYPALVECVKSWSNAHARLHVVLLPDHLVCHFRQRNMPGGGVLIYFSIRERAVSNQPLSDSKNRHCKSRGISLQKISYTFGKNPFVFKKNPSKIRMNPFVLKKSRTLFPISELPLAVNHESFFAF